MNNFSILDYLKSIRAIFASTITADLLGLVLVSIPIYGLVITQSKVSQYFAHTEAIKVFDTYQPILENGISFFWEDLSKDSQRQIQEKLKIKASDVKKFGLLAVPENLYLKDYQVKFASAQAAVSRNPLLRNQIEFSSFLAESEALSIPSGPLLNELLSKAPKGVRSVKVLRVDRKTLKNLEKIRQETKMQQSEIRSELPKVENEIKTAPKPLTFLPRSNRIALVIIHIVLSGLSILGRHTAGISILCEAKADPGLEE